MNPGLVEQLPDGSGARVRLPDGRFLGVRETGVRDGWPMLLFPGTPGSRLSPLPDADSAATREAGARVIVVERPGFGVSTPRPRRRVLDWPADIANVADALGLTRLPSPACPARVRTSRRVRSHCRAVFAWWGCSASCALSKRPASATR